jgi:hypothetical protein
MTMNRETEAAGDTLVDKIEAHMAAAGVSYSAAMRAVVADPANRSLAQAWAGAGAPAVVQGQDAGEVVRDRAEALARAEGIGFGEAAQRVLVEDAGLARAYHAAEPYRVTRLTEKPVHYSQLPDKAKDRHLPLRRLSPGEQRDPAKTYLARMCSVDQGGGVFEVEA